MDPNYQIVSMNSKFYCHEKKLTIKINNFS